MSAVCHPNETPLEVGYLPDGTPMNRAGNAVNHPESIGPDPHAPGQCSFSLALKRERIVNRFVIVQVQFVLAFVFSLPSTSEISAMDCST